MVAQSAGLTPLILNPATGHDSEPLHPSPTHNPFPLDPFWCYLPISFSEFWIYASGRLPHQIYLCMQAFLVFLTQRTCPYHHSLTEFTISTKLGGFTTKLLNCSFISTLSCLHVFLSTLISDTCNLCSSLKIRAHVSQIRYQCYVKTKHIKKKKKKNNKKKEKKKNY